MPRADATMSLNGDAADVPNIWDRQPASEVDAVIDYLWSHPTADSMLGVVMNAPTEESP